MNHRNSQKITVELNIEPISADERNRRRELFERVSLPTLIHRLASAVEQPQALRKSVENRMRGVPVLAVAGSDRRGGAET